MKTTLNEIRKHWPCEPGWKKLLNHLGKTKADDDPVSILTVLNSNGLDDALWCLRAVDGYEKEIRLYAVWGVRQIQRLMKDKRSIRVLDVAEQYARGLATRDQLGSARAAAAAAAEDARDAAWDAAGAAARTARDAAWAEWDAARTAEDAAGAARTARDAAWAEWDAARAAAAAAAGDARGAAWDAAGAAAGAARDAAWTAARTARTAWDAAGAAAGAARTAEDARAAARTAQEKKFREILEAME